MDALSLRKKIHELIDETDEELLQSVYQLLQGSEYTDEFKHFLDSEFTEYQKNKNVISKDEINLLIEEVMKK